MSGGIIIPSKQGIINARIRNARKVKLICSNCGKEFEITYGRYRQFTPNTKIRCKSCASKLWFNDLSEEAKNKIRLDKHNYWQNLSDEKRTKDIELKKKRWENKTPEEKRIHAQKSSENVKKYWQNLSVEERNRRKEVSLKNFEEYRKNCSKEEKARISKLISASSKRFWENISPEKYQELCQLHSKHSKLWWMNAPIEQKKAIANHLSEIAKNWWKNLSKEKYEDWDRRRIQGCINYFNRLKIFPNKNELAFIEYLDKLNILYLWHWYSLIKHKDFDKIYSVNPITNNKVSPFKEWDFKLIFKNKTILVDVDGSIHDYKKIGEIRVSNSNSNMKVAEYMKFNDNKRKYQTDGMDAYAILVYDDNLSESTLVKNILTDEICSFKEFLLKIENL